MYRPRVIPCLLLRNKGLVKSVRFRDHRYVGDPINAVKLFNDLRADELIFLDTQATNQNRTIDRLDGGALLRIEPVEIIGRSGDVLRRWSERPA